MTQAERMFRLERTLGAIIEMCDGSSVIGNAVKALCRINQIDPREVQQVYRDWQAGKYDKVYMDWQAGKYEKVG